MAAFAPRVPCSHASLRCSRPLRVPSAATPLANRPARQQCILVQCQAAQVQEAPAVETAPAFVIDTGKVTVFNAPQFDQLTAAAGSRLVVVDVYTTWCGPCKMIAPELEKFAAELGDRMVMTKIDCTSNNDNKKWAMAQNVKALPTFILFKDGKRVNDMTGAKAANLRKLIDAHI